MERKIRLKKYILILLFICFCFAVGNILAYAPSYLVYADKPVKSDVVVLFIGTDSKARKKEALTLINEGYAKHLIIPARQKIFKSAYRRYYENTHVEALIAKKIMDKAGFNSAIFVSSPLHMRRIKVITGKVFGNSSKNIVFVPTRYENVRRDINGFGLTNLEMIVREYAKLAWFHTYSILN